MIRICQQKASEHNDLVMRVQEAGFSVPTPNQISGLRVGHIFPQDMKSDHPRCSVMGNLLPVAYVGYEHFDLVGEDKPAMAEYHEKLKAVVGYEE